MQQVDKNGAKTLLKLNEVVNKSTGSSAFVAKLIESKNSLNNMNSSLKFKQANNSITSQQLAQTNAINNNNNLDTQMGATTAALTTNDLIKDNRVRFLIEFSAGALGGAVSRTA
jgi:hypothetical protein